MKKKTILDKEGAQWKRNRHDMKFLGQAVNLDGALMNTEESTCDECGRENVCWFAPSEIWNAAARDKDGSDPMLCPVCFIKRAERAGFNGAAWRIAPEGRLE